MNYPSFPLSKVTENLEKELDLYFFHDNNAVREKNLTARKDISNVKEIQQTLVSHVSYKNVYSPTKVKARNSLTNISRNQVKDVDLTTDFFVIDCYTFILFYLNPFYLERTFEDVINREKVEAVWHCFMPSYFYIFICKSEHFTTLNKISLKYQTAYEIISKFVEEGGLAQFKCFFFF